MGLIEMKQGEGTYVKNFDSSSLTKSLNNRLLMKKEDILNLLEVRKVLEVGAVRAAAAKRTEDNLQNMKHWLDEMAKSVGDEKLVKSRFSVPYGNCRVLRITTFCLNL